MVGFILQELRYSSSASRDPIWFFVWLCLLTLCHFILTPSRSPCRLSAIVLYYPCLPGLALSCFPCDHTNSDLNKWGWGVGGGGINQLIPLINFSHKILNKTVCNSALALIVRINSRRLIMFILHLPESHVKPLNTTCV